MMSPADFLRASSAINDCTSSPIVREILSSVAQDAQNETIDMERTWDQLLFNPANSVHKSAMYEIRTALQICAAVICVGIVQSPIESGTRFVVFGHVRREAAEFLFENHTRILKLLAASRVMEHRNLASFGVTPQPTDTPTHIVKLAVALDDFQSNSLPAVHQAWNNFCAQAKYNTIVKAPPSV